MNPERDAALDRLWNDRRADMVGLAYLLTSNRDTAEDLMQDAFATVHRRWSQLADPTAAAAYLRVCVVNASHSWLRRLRVARAHTEFADRPAPGADHTVVLAEEHRAVAVAVHSLPRRQREVVVLRYWSQMSDEAIAEAMSVSISTVRSSLSRARDTLALRLEA